MKIILHIGEGKTGTTSIQKSLCASKFELEKKGILYLPIAGSPNQCWLNVPIGGAIRTNRDTALIYVETWFDNIKRRCSKNDISAILISAETLFNHAADEIIDFLESRIKFDSINVICYLRETGDFYLSLVQQVIKGGADFPLPNEYSHRISNKLKGWFDRVGKQSVTLRNFNPSSWQDSSVVNDFSKVISNIVGFSVTLIDVISVNKSLSAEQMVALAEFRSQKLSNYEGKLHSASNSLISLFNAINKNMIITGSKPVLTSFARNQIVSRNAKYFRELVEICPDLVADQSWENWFQQINQYSYNCVVDQSEWWGKGAKALHKILALYSPIIIGIYMIVMDLDRKKANFNNDPCREANNNKLLEQIKNMEEYDHFKKELKMLKDYENI